MKSIIMTIEEPKNILREQKFDNANVASNVESIDMKTFDNTKQFALAANKFV